MSYRVVKAAINFLDFEEMYADMKTGVLERITDNLYMMHVRAATKGVINQQNSHPYDFPSFVAAHNGTLKDKQYDHKEKTDTFLFFEEFQRKLDNSPEADFDEVLADHINTLETGGAYAITLLNKDNRCMYFLRNLARPLNIAINMKRGVIYWASEQWMLTGILGRHGLKTDQKDEKDNDFKVYHFEANQVHRLELDAIKKGEENLFYKTDILARCPSPSFETELPWAGEWRSEQAYTQTKKEGEEEKKVSVPLVKFKKHRPVYWVNCIGCQRDMNLIDMHEGVCIDDARDIYQCSECAEYDTNSTNLVVLN